MPKQEINEFAKILVQKVRDSAIKGCDMNLRTDVQHLISRRWKEVGANGDLESIASVLIPDIVDETIFYLLRAIDDGLLPMSFIGSNAKKVDLSKDGLGELSGWYMGSDGWRTMYSQERFVDDSSDPS